jgi:hypothetical protein
MFFFVVADAAWFESVPTQVIQPDGTMMDVLVTGDEFHSWYHDEFGYTIIKDEITGYYSWASTSKYGTLVPTIYPVHLYSPQSKGLSPHANISNEVYFYRLQSENHNAVKKMILMK